MKITIKTDFSLSSLNSISKHLLLILNKFDDIELDYEKWKEKNLKIRVKETEKSSSYTSISVDDCVCLDIYLKKGFHVFSEIISDLNELKQLKSLKKLKNVFKSEEFKIFEDIDNLSDFEKEFEKEFENFDEEFDRMNYTNSKNPLTFVCTRTIKKKKKKDKEKKD